MKGRDLEEKKGTIGSPAFIVDGNGPSGLPVQAVFDEGRLPAKTPEIKGIRRAYLCALFFAF